MRENLPSAAPDFGTTTWGRRFRLLGFASLTRFAPTILVFAASLTLLAWNAGAPGIATSYVDPVGRIPAQDEAVYGASSLEMAQAKPETARAGPESARDGRGDWLTPRFLGRYVLYKPPVLYWLSALSIKAGAPGAWAFRIPSILAGAATATLIFAWLRMSTPIAAALTGVILLLSSHLFFVISRTGLMDALLTFEIVAAMYALARDPRLESGRSTALFGIASGAAIMTKSTAGLFPLLILAGFFAISKDRLPVRRILHVVAIAAAVALPWHLWQLAVHTRWFWSEYILTEQLGSGFGSKIQSTHESHAGYYLKRLLLLDPVLAVAGVASIFALLKTKPQVPARALTTRLALVWIAVVLAGCAAFQYRNTSYLLPVYPALALLAASAISTIPKRFASLMLAAAALLLVAKTFAPNQPWGIPFQPESVNATDAALDAYASLHRGNDLILVDPDDQFYSADLVTEGTLTAVRYCYLDPRASAPAPLDFAYLGITVTAGEFARLAELRPIYVQRLHEWGLDSGDAIATVILARDENDVHALIASHPEDDFLVPARFVSIEGPLPWLESHDLSRLPDRPSSLSVSLSNHAGSRVFFLSRKEIQRP
jgi:hypothetical protein